MVYGFYILTIVYKMLYVLYLAVAPVPGIFIFDTLCADQQLAVPSATILDPTAIYINFNA